MEGKNIRDCVVLGSSRLRNIRSHTEYKLLDYRPHESPQSVELPCVIKHKDDGAHSMELGSEVSHEPVNKIEGLLVCETSMQSTRGFEGHSQSR